MLIRQNGKKECRGTEINMVSRMATFKKHCTWGGGKKKAQVMKFTAEKCNNTDNKSCPDNILEDIHLEEIQFM